MEEMIFCGVRCLIQYPEGFEEGKQYPLLIILNGAGSRGDDIDVLRSGSFWTHQHQVFPFAVITPLCTENTWFDMWERLTRFVKHVTGLSFVERDRVYLMGASMGGYATWQMAMSLPEYFAAIVPICGGGMYWNAGRFVGIPIWAFHGKLDPTVYVEESEKMVDAVNKRGGNAKLTVYPENSHDALTDTYANQEVFLWLLQHRKKNAPLPEDQYKDPKVYG